MINNIEQVLMILDENEKAEFTHYFEEKDWESCASLLCLDVDYRTLSEQEQKSLLRAGFTLYMAAIEQFETERNVENAISASECAYETCARFLGDRLATRQALTKYFQLISKETPWGLDKIIKELGPSGNIPKEHLHTVSIDKISEILVDSGEDRGHIVRRISKIIFQYPELDSDICRLVLPGIGGLPALGPYYEPVFFPENSRLFRLDQIEDYLLPGIQRAARIMTRISPTDAISEFSNIENLVVYKENWDKTTSFVHYGHEVVIAMAQELISMNQSALADILVAALFCSRNYNCVVENDPRLASFRAKMESGSQQSDYQRTKQLEHYSKYNFNALNKY